MIIDWNDPNAASAREILIKWLKASIKNLPAIQRVWLDHPSNLYLLKQQSDIYLQLMKDQKYSKHFHDPVKSLFEVHIDSLLSGMHGTIDVVDLGPGYPDKSFPVLSALSKNKPTGFYIPVDINLPFLQISEQAVSHFNIPVKPLHCLFEDLPSRLATLPDEQQKRSRLIILGLTFMNYRPESIVSLLANLARPSDVVIIASELLHAEIPDPETKDYLITPYKTEHAMLLNQSVIELLEIPVEHTKYLVEMPHHRIEMGFELLEDVTLDDELRLPKGTTLITAISCRYTIDELIETLKKHFNDTYIFTDSNKNTAIAKCTSSLINPSR